MSPLPPGPGGGILTTLGIIRDPYGALARHARRYGDPFTIPVPLQGKIVVTADPGAIRSVYGADPDTFGSSAARTLGPFVGAGSVVVLEGGAHRRARKLLNPPFHGERMRAYGAVIALVTRERSRHLGPGVRFSVQELAQAISLEVILQAIFGVRAPQRRASFAVAVCQLTSSLGPAVGFAFLRHSFGGLGPWARFQRRRAVLAGLVTEELTARRRPGAVSHEDILSLLMAARYEDGAAMTDAAIFDQLLTLVVAGHETTTITLTWALYWLHRHPEALCRLIEELDATAADAEPEVLAALPYLEATVQETLRLNPIVPLVTRRLARPFELAGHLLPEGMTVGLATGLVHYRDDLYPDPERFRPERFLARSFGLGEYFPFGGGARRCLGASFAMYEVKIVLATLLRTLRMERVDDRRVRPTLGLAGMVPGRRVELRVARGHAR